MQDTSDRFTEEYTENVVPFERGKGRVYTICPEHSYAGLHNQALVAVNHRPGRSTAPAILSRAVTGRHQLHVEVCRRMTEEFHS